MGYAEYLKDLVRPLGVYRLEDSINGAELEAVGAQLDAVEEELAHTEREMLVDSAEDTGLLAVEALLGRRPVTDSLARRQSALAALLRIGGDSFTLAAINDNLKGCGLNALAHETGETGRVEVTFPEVPGIPDGFEEMRKIIEEIIPCHLEITYVYWYITWAMMEARFATWGDVEAMGLSWGELEKLVR